MRGGPYHPGQFRQPPSQAQLERHRRQSERRRSATRRACPDCQGFGYVEDGTPEGRECETCCGAGVIEDSR